MSCLQDILSVHKTLLLIDACSEHVQTAFLQNPNHVVWQKAVDEAGSGIFVCVSRLGIRMEDVGGYVFCEGPGSILGIRTTAAAIRAWRIMNPKPVWAYKSLDLLASSLTDPHISVISDARRDMWHIARQGEKIGRVSTLALMKEPGLATPSGFRQWSKLPETITPQQFDYDLEELLPRIWTQDLFQPSDTPDAFLHEEPSYATWSPQIHRAST